MSLTGKPLVALLSAQVRDPSVIEGWMMLVVASSVGYTCGEQCGVVGVSYENSLPFCVWEVCGEGERYVVDSGVNPVGFGTCQTAQPMMPCAPFAWVCMFSHSIPIHAFSLHFVHGSFLR